MIANLRKNIKKNIIVLFYFILFLLLLYLIANLTHSLPETNAVIQALLK